MSALEGLPFPERTKLLEKHAILILDVLASKGPLTHEALKFFVHQRYGFIDRAVYSGGLNLCMYKYDVSDEVIQDEDGSYSSVLMLPDQSEADIVVPPRQDYVKAYHQLFEYITEVRKNPKMLDLPSEWNKVLGLPIM